MYHCEFDDIKQDHVFWYRGKMYKKQSCWLDNYDTTRSILQYNAIRVEDDHKILFAGDVIVFYQ
jgi:hypothetical protein